MPTPPSNYPQKVLITTPRLRISRLTPADAPFMRELLNSPPWLQYIGDRNVHTEADALKYLEDRIFPAYTSTGLGGWRVALKDTDVVIGNCGFYQRDFLDFPDFGFAFLPAYHGQGYGYEAATACLAYGLSELGITEVLAITLEMNQPSIGLLEKLGFWHDGTVNWPGDDAEEMLLYRLKS